MTLGNHEVRFALWRDGLFPVSLGHCSGDSSAIQQGDSHAPHAYPARLYGTEIYARRAGEFPAKPRACRSPLSSPLRQPGPRARNLDLHSKRASLVALLPEKESRLTDQISPEPVGRLIAQKIGVRHAALAGAAGWTWGVFFGDVKTGRTRHMRPRILRLDKDRIGGDAEASFTGCLDFQTQVPQATAPQ